VVLSHVTRLCFHAGALAGSCSTSGQSSSSSSSSLALVFRWREEEEKEEEEAWAVVTCWVVALGSLGAMIQRKESPSCNESMVVNGFPLCSKRILSKGTSIFLAMR